MFVKKFARTLAALVLIAAAQAPQAAPSATLRQAIAQNRVLPAAPTLTEEALGRRARLREVKLSPDGAWIAFLEAEGNSASLNLQSTTHPVKRQLLAAVGRAELSWSRDSQVLFIDTGDGVSVLHIADGSSAKIVAFDVAKGERMLAVDQRRPHSMLAEEFDRAVPAYRLSRINVDGAREVLYEGKKKLLDFLLAPNGQVSVIRSLDDQFMQVVAHKRAGRWVMALRCKRLQSCDLVSASDDGRLLNMLLDANDDRRSLVQIDLASNARRVLHTDPAALADLRQVILSPGARQAELAVYDSPARRNYGLNPAASRAAADIGERFPATDISVEPSDSARWLLTERGARLAQERYWLYDRTAHSFAEVLRQERALGKPVPEQQLARKIALDYRASDGATVHGYLSLPPGTDAATLPMVTMVHGGPWGRFEGGYHMLVQLLVNRGFAVFQPNFRASIGYGEKYMLAPKADFGNGRVQADIIDGVRWLLANGVGDSKRLAIMGDSFGGYATLMALTHTPDLFRFGMAVVPPTDFGRTMQLAARPAADGALPFADYLAERGIALDDKAALKRIADASPAANAAKVTRPLLIIAGGQDEMVDIAAATDYVARLQGLGRPVSLLIEPEEGHNLRKPVTRQAYLYLLQRMLHRYLGGPPVPAPGPELASFLNQAMKANGALAL